VYVCKSFKAYKSRVSGPILDRIDILLPLKAVKLKGHDFRQNESPEGVRRRILAARERQSKDTGRKFAIAVYRLSS
jgi:magnesium chelatase family protein